MSNISKTEIKKILKFIFPKTSISYKKSKKDEKIVFIQEEKTDSEEVIVFEIGEFRFIFYSTDAFKIDLAYKNLSYFILGKIVHNVLDVEVDS